MDGSGSGSRPTTSLVVRGGGYSGLIPNCYDYVQSLTPALIRHDAQNFGDIVRNVTGSVLDSQYSVFYFSRPGILLIRSI